MTEKKWLYTTFNVLLYAVGFPVLTIICLVKSIEWNSYGMYGASSFAPLIAALILWALTASIQAGVYFACKKKGKTSSNLALKLIAVPIALIIGIFGLLDIAMPSLLKDATSNTILYEDVVDDWQGTHQKIYDRVELFKEKNGLDKDVKYTDKEFQDIFKPLFESMDEAYAAFDPLAIEMALDQDDLLGAILNGKFPLSVAATLLLETNVGNLNNHNLTDKELVQTIIDEILPLLGQIQDPNFNFSLALNEILVTKDCKNIKWNIFNILGENMLAPDVDPNADIRDNDGNKMGACLGYMDMAWLNGVPMMFFIPLMSVRNIFYLFAAIIALCTMMQYYISAAYSKKFNEPFSIFMLKTAKPKNA